MIRRVGSGALRAAASVGAVALALGASSAHAALRVETSPTLGQAAPFGEGWYECAVRLDASDGHARRGHVELVSSTADGREVTLVTRAPFAVAAGETVVLRLPTHGPSHQLGVLRTRVLDERDRLIEQVELTPGVSAGPLLVDVHAPSRLAAALADVVVPMRSPGARPTKLLVGVPRHDPASGDPLLPERAAAWSSATVALVPTDALVALAERERDALLGWVLSGGSLALTVARPEDLRHPTLVALLGAAATLEPRAAADVLAPLDGFTPPGPPEPGDEDAAVATPGVPREVHPPAAPPSALLASLAGYAGGNLRASRWGASASYGLGEVHLLAFDPSLARFADEPWAQARVVDLLAHAEARSRIALFPQGSASRSDDEAATRTLDPNQGARWAIVVAAVLLLAFAVMAGPVNFASAARSGRPLVALRRLPIASLLVFALVFGMGLTARGCAARSLHLSLLEAGSGAARATARRWRAFYTPRERVFDVVATDTSSTLSVLADERRGDERLELERDGMHLAGVVGLSWDTRVVREDGFASLGRGVSIGRDASGAAFVENGTPRALLGVVVYLPGEAERHFARLPAGARVAVASGALLPAAAAPPAGPMAHALPRTAVDDDLAQLLDSDAAGLGTAWNAVIEASGGQTAVVPSDVPALLAQVEGGEGATTDGRVPVVRDRTLLRVVGWGVSP